MPLTTAGANACLSGGLGNAFTHLGAIKDDFAEVSGGSYARQAVAWDAAGSGLRVAQDAESIPIPAATTVIATAGYDALSAGNKLIVMPIGTGLVKGVATVEADDENLTSKAHGLANGDRVFVTDVGGGTLPTGLSETVLYWVVNTATDTFQLSTTSGGSAVNVTVDGEVAFYETQPEAFTNAGSLDIADGNLVLDGTAFGLVA